MIRMEKVPSDYSRRCWTSTKIYQNLYNSTNTLVFWDLNGGSDDKSLVLILFELGYLSTQGFGMAYLISKPWLSKKKMQILYRFIIFWYLGMYYSNYEYRDSLLSKL